MRLLIRYLLGISILLFSIAVKGQEKQELDSLSKALHPVSDSLRVLGYIGYANDAVQLAKPWRKYLDSATFHAEKMSPFYTAQCLLSKGYCLRTIHQFDSAVTYYRKGSGQLVAYREKAPESMIKSIDKATANSSNNIGGMLMYTNLDSGLYYLLDARETFALYDLKLSLGTNSIPVGIIYSEQGKYDKAVEEYRKALEIFKDLENVFWEGVTCTNLASVYQIFEDYPKALQYQERALELANKDGNLIGIGGAYDGLSNLYQNGFEDYEKSISTRAKAIAIWDKGVGDPTLTLYNQAFCYLEMNSLDSALHYFQRTIQVMDTNDYRFLGWTYMAQCKALFLKGDLDAAQKSADKGIPFVDLYGGVEQNDFAYGVYADLLNARGDFEGAFKALNTKLIYQDSLSNNEMKALVIRKNVEAEIKENELKTRLEEKREKEILREQIQKQTEQRNLLIILGLVLILIGALGFFAYRSNRARKLLEMEQRAIELQHLTLRAQMNPHFISNCLNSIQRVYIEGDLQAANHYLTEFGHLVRRILKDTSKTAITLAAELECLALYLEMEKLRSPDLLSYKIEVDKEVDQYSCFMAPMVIQPFVENAIWHGVRPLKSHGEVLISIRYSNDKESLDCLVSDTGVGMGAQKRTKSLERESMGIKLTEKRLGKPVNISARKGGGTEVRFEIPTILSI